MSKFIPVHARIILPLYKHILLRIDRNLQFIPLGCCLNFKLATVTKEGGT